MSHNQVELQRFISTASASSMSGSGSFAGESVHHHTDADASTNPVYSSIPESQMAHQQFVARQQSPPSQVPQPSNHTHLPPTHLPTDSNQYDSIPDKHKARVIDSVPNKPPSGGTPEKQPIGGAVGVAGSTGMLQADNVLYAGMDEANEMRHKTLTMTNTETFKRFREERSPEHRYKGEDRNECRTCALLLWGGCVTGLVVMALAGAAVALAIMFTGFVDVCSKNCPTQDPNTDSSMQNSNEALLMRIDELEARLNESLSNPATMALPTTGAATSFPTTPPGDMATPTEMTTPPPSTMDQDVSITLKNVSLFMDCTTSIERTCTILTTEAQCTTGFGAIYQRPGEFIMDISCIRQNLQSADTNGLSWVLSIDSANNEVECLCYVVQPVTGAGGTRRNETCGLRVTRCRTSSDITVNATLTSSP